MPQAPPDDMPRLLVVSGFPPTTRIGGGLILRNLLQNYSPERLTILTNQHVLDELSVNPDGGGLLAARHLGVTPWRSNIPGLRRALRSLNVVKIFSTTAMGSRLLTPKD